MRVTAGLGSALKVMPMEPRSTLWAGETNWLKTWAMVLEGMAKPTPW